MVRTYPATANVDTSAQAAVLDAVDSTYSLLYFDTQGICNPIRDMLALSGAQWKQLFPRDWENEDRADKESTPFEVMPVLYVHSKDGKETVVIAESKVIEQYLANKFGFLGRNNYEQVLVNSFVFSTGGLWDDLLYGGLNVQAPPEVKQEIIAGFLAKKIPNWIRIHEQHLAANGRNGHYVGDQITLADLRTDAMLRVIQRFPASAELLNAEKTPGLVKLQEEINAHPKIAEWRASELARSLRPSRQFPALPRASGTGIHDRKDNQ
ncbi:hypothetical protein BG006_003537 [Podila minutissima]|uniref:Glutathione S-transferase n=1 Tax=Podila minutissima TaxID=64525 RepID=A0A9P5SWA6_9FUNG|nr:hypothetical protein BG006_003537 [Podila minutissima]